MITKLIRSMSGGELKRAAEANEMAAMTLRKLADENQPAEPLRGSGSWDQNYAGGQAMTPLPKAEPLKKTADDSPQRVAIHPVRMMNTPEMTLFHWLCDRLEAEAPLFSIHAQVSMSAFLHVDRRAAKRDQMSTRGTFAQKRVDFLIADDLGLPIVAIEYHGEGHCQGDYVKRDEAKARALDEAGVPLIVIPNGTLPSEVWAQLQEHLDDDE